MSKPLKPEADETKNRPTKDYYFGKVEVVSFQELSFPQFEISVFARADIMGNANCDGGGPGDQRTCPSN